MKKALSWMILLAAAAGGAAVYYLRPLDRTAPPPPAPPAAAIEQPAEPVIRHPIPEPEPLPQAAAAAPSEEAAEPPAPPPPPPEPLPPLEHSDAAIQQGLSALADPLQLVALLKFDHFIQRVVVTVENLTAAKLPHKYLAADAPAGRFLVSGEDDELAISEQNAARYLPFVELLEAIDTGRLVGIYIRFYPLFQQAYQALGYPTAYFNDRLVEVIDHLLATPQVQGPIRLVRPHVLYQYADPELEALSAGQKTLLRIGPDNAARVKAKLQEIRERLAAPAPH